MSRRYAPDHKDAVLQILENNNGDITVTSFQTGVPRRTIYAWRVVQLHVHQQQHDITVQEQPSQLHFPDEIAAIRTQMILTAIDIAANLEDFGPPQHLHHRVSSLGILLDRIIKLDKQFEPKP